MYLGKKVHFTFWIGALRVKEFTRRSCVSSISCFGSIRCARIDTNSGGSLLKTDRGSSAELLGCCVCSVCCQKCKGSNLLRSWHRSRRNTEWKVTVRAGNVNEAAATRFELRPVVQRRRLRHMSHCEKWSVSKMKVIREKNKKLQEQGKTKKFPLWFPFNFFCSVFL